MEEIAHMKLKQPENPNYTAAIVKVTSIHKLENSDHLYGVPLLGMQAVVTKDVKVGDVGVVFVAGTQLSEDYCKNNNLYRHQELNKSKDKTGFIEDNRRVRAIKLRGNRSDALFLPIESLAYTKADLSRLEVGDSFDELNGVKICCKYEVKRRRPVSQHEKNKLKTFKRVEDRMFPRHYDTSQYYRVEDTFKPDTDIIVTQKLHGTLLRFSHIKVNRKLSLFENVLSRLGVKIDKQEYANVYGSNRVVKDANNKNQSHYYKHDIWTEAGKKFDDVVPKDFIVYGELIGWTSEGVEIQKGYTYNIEKGTNKFYIYRVAHINSQGILTDLSWDQVKEFTRDRGMDTVPELFRGKHKDFNPTEWLDVKYCDKYANAVELSEESPCDEGVCIRVDGMAPYIAKLKSPEFFAHEECVIESEARDIEEEGKIE